MIAGRSAKNVDLLVQNVVVVQIQCWNYSQESICFSEGKFFGTWSNETGAEEYTIPASNAFWGQKAGCWDNPKPLKVSGVLLANFAFAVSQRRCLLVHSRQLATCKHFATQNQ